MSGRVRRRSADVTARRVRPCRRRVGGHRGGAAAAAGARHARPAAPRTGPRPAPAAAGDRRSCRHSIPMLTVIDAHRRPRRNAGGRIAGRNAANPETREREGHGRGAWRLAARSRVARAAWRESSGVVHDTLSRAAARRGGNPQEHFKRQCRSAPALIRLNPRPRSTSSLGRATARAVL